MSTTAEPSAPAPSLVRRVINDTEYWVHAVTGEIHSLFTHNKTVIHETEATAETAIGDAAAAAAQIAKDVTG